MARITASVFTSHVPAIGAALDLGKTGEPYWQPVFKGYDFVKQWVKDNPPDVVFLVFNDHATAFSLDMIPTFAIGTAAEFQHLDSFDITFRPQSGEQAAEVVYADRVFGVGELVAVCFCNGVVRSLDTGLEVCGCFYFRVMSAFCVRLHHNDDLVRCPGGDSSRRLTLVVAHLRVKGNRCKLLS